jgi:hypothetical protein
VAYEVVLDRGNIYRILLEERPEGIYINVFETRESAGPYQDYLQDDLAMAMRACEQDFGIKEEEWRVVPNEKWH